MDTTMAFNILVQSIWDDLDQVQKAGSEHFKTGQMQKVRDAADRADGLQDILETIIKAQEQWKRVMQGTVPMGVKKPPVKRVEKLPRGRRTPESLFRLPVLQVLVDLGGSGETKIVLDRVGEMMANILNEYDRQMLPTGKEIRWRNTAMWARADMVREGLMSNQSPVGLWEITEEGREYLERNC